MSIRFPRFLAATFGIGLACTGIHPSYADLVRRDWSQVPGTTVYEYEVSESARFVGSSLVRQGSSPDPHFSTDLRPGIYFFRHRSLNEKGNPDKWSTPQKIVVRGQSQFEFATPRTGDIIDLPEGREASVYFEWATVPGAQDYEITVSPGDAARSLFKPVQRTSTNISISLEGLSPGSWTAKIEARSGGILFGQSKEITFQILSRPQPRPQLLNPREGDQYPAYEMIRVRWLRKAPGTNSKVFVYRIDTERELISQEPVAGSASWIPALKPGRYQVTVRDFLKDGTRFVEESSGFTVDVDPLGSAKKQLNLRIQAIPFGLMLGPSSATSPLLSGTSAKGSTPQFTLGDLRTRFIFQRKFGIVAHLSHELRSFQNTEGTESLINSNPKFLRGGVGGLYQTAPWGPTKPLTFQASITYSDFIGLSNRPADQGRNLHYGFVSLVPAAEFEYSGWNSRYSLAARAELRFPLFAVQGAVLGTGRSSLLPGIFGEGILKRRFAQNSWGLIGSSVLFQRNSVSETNQSTPTSHRDVLLGIFLGLEFRL